MKRLNSIKMLTYFIAFIGFIPFLSCSSKDDIKKNVAKMEATPVVIDMGKMSIWIPDNNKYVSCELGKNLLMLLYHDHGIRNKEIEMAKRITVFKEKITSPATKEMKKEAGKVSADIY